MFPDTTKPTEILHYAYLNIIIFPIDFPTEIAVMCINYGNLFMCTSMDI
jgi:hypothetical protein